MPEVREYGPEIHDTKAELAQLKANVQESQERSDLKIEGELKTALEQKDFGKLEKKFFEKFSKIILSEDPIVKPLIKELAMDKLTSVLLKGDSPRRASALRQLEDIAQNGAETWQKRAIKALEDYKNGASYYEGKVEEYPEK